MVIVYLRRPYRTCRTGECSLKLFARAINVYLLNVMESSMISVHRGFGCKDAAYFDIRKIEIKTPY